MNILDICKWRFEDGGEYIIAFVEAVDGRNPCDKCFLKERGLTDHCNDLGCEDMERVDGKNCTILSEIEVPTGLFQIKDSIYTCREVSGGLTVGCSECCFKNNNDICKIFMCKKSERIDNKTVCFEFNYRVYPYSDL